MNNTEVWKHIPNYEGLYQVSNIGNVKSLGNDKARKERILKPNKNKAGYYYLNICKKGKVKSMKVHVLVAMAFLGHNPDGTHRICVDHINNNPLDNRVENLQLISQRENASKDRKGSSKYTGVFWDKRANKWKTQIYIKDKSKHLGYFLDEYEAHLAYQNKLNEILK
jgi:hypothetical protein